MMVDMLTAFGFDGHGVADAETALVSLGQAKDGLSYDVVIMDWKLPGMDGLTAAREILANKTTSNLPIIMVSAYGREKEVQEAEKMGVRTFLFKPIKMSALFDAIMMALGYPLSPNSGPSPAPSTSFEGYRLLLAEDNEANQMVALEILKIAGFQVDLAVNGLQAVDMVARHDYAAILMDVQMPEMDGLEATRRIRQMDEYAGLPIIAMTANAMRGDREKCIAAGMNDYLSKPINRHELIRCLNRWITDVSAADGPNEPQTVKSLQVLNLPGIDAAEALKRLGISVTAYQRVLDKFRQEHGQTLSDMETAVKTQRFGRIKLLAHSVAGAGGNIGATALKQTARALETAADLKKGGNLEQLYSQLVAASDTVIKSIETHLAPLKTTVLKQPKDPISGDVLTAEAMSQYRRFLQKLKIHLTEMDPVGAEEVVSDLTALSTPAHLTADIKDLAAQVEDLDYDGALATLKRMLDQIA